MKDANQIAQFFVSPVHKQQDSATALSDKWRMQCQGKNSHSLSKLGELIRTKRTEKLLSRDDMARLSGIPVHIILLLERGLLDRESVTDSLLEAVADTFDITTGVLTQLLIDKTPHTAVVCCEENAPMINDHGIDLFTFQEIEPEIRLQMLRAWLIQEKEERLLPNPKIVTLLQQIEEFLQPVSAPFNALFKKEQSKKNYQQPSLPGIVHNFDGCGDRENWSFYPAAQSNV